MGVIGPPYTALSRRVGCGIGEGDPLHLVRRLIGTRACRAQLDDVTTLPCVKTFTASYDEGRRVWRVTDEQGEDVYVARTQQRAATAARQLALRHLGTLVVRNAAGHQTGSRSFASSSTGPQSHNV